MFYASRGPPCHPRTRGLPPIVLQADVLPGLRCDHSAMIPKKDQARERCRVVAADRRTSNEEGLNDCTRLRRRHRDALPERKPSDTGGGAVQDAERLRYVEDNQARLQGLRYTPYGAAMVLTCVLNASFDSPESFFDVDLARDRSYRPDAGRDGSIGPRGFLVPTSFRAGRRAGTTRC